MNPRRARAEKIEGQEDWWQGHDIDRGGWWLEKERKMVINSHWKKGFNSLSFIFF